MTAFTYAVGDQVRVGMEPGRVTRIRVGQDLVDVWTAYGLRTVSSALIHRPRKGDVVQSVPSAWAPSGRAGRR